MDESAIERLIASASAHACGFGSDAREILAETCAAAIAEHRALVERVAVLERERDALRAALEAEVAEIDRDARFHYKPALVQINAPLALIQVDLKARIGLARRLLGLLSASNAASRAALSEAEREREA